MRPLGPAWRTPARLRVLLLVLAGVLAVSVALRLYRGGVPRKLEVPRPVSRNALGPQLRAYLDEKIAWVQDNPLDPQRQATLGMVYAANQLWSEARLAFSNVVRLSPREPLAALYVAVATQELGDQAEAFGLFRHLTTRFPDFPQGYYRLGEAALRAGAVDEAAAAFKRLTDLAPQEWRGYAGLGEVCLRRSQYAAAAVQLEKALQLAPDAGNAHHLLGTAYRNLGRADEARLHLSLGLNQPNYPMPDPWADTAPQHMKLIQDQLDQVRELNRAGHADRSVALLREALKYEPTNLSLLNNLAMALNQSGQAETARAVLANVLEQNPRNLPAHITLSFSLQALGKPDEALAWADKALALSANTVQPFLARANALLALERDADALAAFESAARCEPDNAEIQIEMGDVLLQNLNRPADALEHYEKAAELNPALGSAQVRLAQVRAERGELDAARAAVNRLRLLDPRNPALPLLEQSLAARGAAQPIP